MLKRSVAAVAAVAIGVLFGLTSTANAASSAPQKPAVSTAQTAASGFIPATASTRGTDRTGVVPFGTNGQQIAFVDDLLSIYSVCLYGHNQYGSSASHCWNTPSYRTDLSGWFWVGTVQINEYYQYNEQNQAPTQYAYVPRSAPTNWWCFSDYYGNEGAC